MSPLEDLLTSAHRVWKRILTGQRSSRPYSLKTLTGQRFGDTHHAFCRSGPKLKWTYCPAGLNAACKNLLVSSSACASTDVSFAEAALTARRAKEESYACTSQVVERGTLARE
jgi:hypothetical protein